LKLQDFEPKIKAVGKAFKEPQALLTQIAFIVEAAAKPRTPVLTGNLRRSIHSRVEANKAYVGSNVSYAIFVHEGTAHMAARPFIRDAIEESTPKILQVAAAYGDAQFKKMK
jgi:HK97 gp10 family phage protein